MYWGSSESVLKSRLRRYRGKVQLIFTSPPFPLNRKKKYGNQQGVEYLRWLAEFAPLFSDLLKDNGSIVMELGNAWEPGEPVMSTLALEALLEFKKAGAFSLCQQFVCHNPAKLPTPAQWVTIERIRVKDSYTHVWWMGKTSRPKASNRRVLKEYSSSMLNLLSSQKYNAGPRPSEHRIGEKSFLRNNGGAIPSNVLISANTRANDTYLAFCKKHSFLVHPARMSEDLPNFFINFLTTEKDLVLDPFAGSNTTGSVAEQLNRRWLSIEPNIDYVVGSAGRFSIE
jgi:DNA modification methylase